MRKVEAEGPLHTGGAAVAQSRDRDSSSRQTGLKEVQLVARAQRNLIVPSSLCIDATISTASGQEVLYRQAQRLQSQHYRLRLLRRMQLRRL